MFLSMYPKMQMRLYILRTSCLLLMQAHLVLSNITGKLVCQTNIMGTISTLVTFRNFVWLIHKMNKSFLAFTGKLRQERFSANITLDWSSAVYFIGKGLTWHARGLLRVYLLCDNGDVWYFCRMREGTARALFEIYKYKNAPV